MKTSAAEARARARNSHHEAGASQSVMRRWDLLRSWADNHRKVAGDSFKRLTANFAASFMTWMVIGIAIAMPAWMYVLLANAAAVSDEWEGHPRIMLYLESRVTFKNAIDISEHLLTLDGVSDTEYISPSAALEEFKSLSGFGQVLDSLDENPLPAVIMVTPDSETIDGMEVLIGQFSAMPLVESVSVDLQWLKRLYSILELAQRGILAIAGVLAAAVALVIGNTIRLAIESRRAEIEVIKLVGGTDAFVRRPFLYTGFWYGLGGGLVAWILVELSLIWLSTPVAELAGLYHSDFNLLGLGADAGMLIFVVGAGLGLAGAWLAVNRHLDSIQPK